MSKRRERDEDTPDVYFIPPNYVDASGVMGGMFRVRNAIESVILGVLIVWPLFHVTNGLGLTLRVGKIIIGCESTTASYFLFVACS